MTPEPLGARGQSVGLPAGHSWEVEELTQQGASSLLAHGEESSDGRSACRARSRSREALCALSEKG